MRYAECVRSLMLNRPICSSAEQFIVLGHKSFEGLDLEIGLGQFEASWVDGVAAVSDGISRHQ